MKTYRSTMNISELCEEYQFSRPTAYAYVKMDGFPAIRVGRKWLIMREEARIWMLNHPNALRELTHGHSV